MKGVDAVGMIYFHRIKDFQGLVPTLAFATHV